MHSLKDRLAAVCRFRETSLRQVCLTLKISYSHCVRAVNAGKPHYKHLKTLAQHLKCDNYWLISSIGNPPWDATYAKYLGTTQSDQSAQDIANNPLIKHMSEVLRKKSDSTENYVLELEKDYVKIEIYFKLICDMYLELEDTFKDNKIAYSQRSFERVREFHEDVLKSRADT